MVPDRWFVLTVRVGAETDSGRVLEGLLELGATAIEERGPELVTYLPPPDDPASRAEEVRAALEEAAGGSESVRVSWGWQPHEEWSDTWRRGLGPRRIGRRILVSPTWTDPGAGDDDVVIRIDPGMAFGTAEHATTRGCLELLEEVVEPGVSIVDVGAGTGILSIAAALLGADEIIAAESDDLACEAVLENAEVNGVAGKIRVLPGALSASGLAALGPVDGIAANIQSGVLRGLLPGAGRALEPGGWLILGGILVSEREDVISAAEAEGFEPEEEIAEGEWWSGRFRRMPDLRAPSPSSPPSPSPG